MGTARREGTCEVAAASGCHFFDCNTVTPASRVDGIHLDADQHLALGIRIAEEVRPLLAATKGT